MVRWLQVGKYENASQRITLRSLLSWQIKVVFIHEFLGISNVVIMTGFQSTMKSYRQRLFLGECTMQCNSICFCALSAASKWSILLCSQVQDIIGEDALAQISLDAALLCTAQTLHHCIALHHWCSAPSYRLQFTKQQQWRLTSNSSADQLLCCNAFSTAATLGSCMCFFACVKDD